MPTPRPSTVTIRSFTDRPVPSSTIVLPVATAPPTARSVGTTCSGIDTPLPCTRTAPVRARAGTTTVSVRPSSLTAPVRTSVPSFPVSSTAANSTCV